MTRSPRLHVSVAEHLAGFDREIDDWLQTFSDEAELLRYLAGWKERRERLGSFDPRRDGTYAIALFRRWRRLHHLEADG